MDSDRGKLLLDILIENSARILRAGFGVNCAELSFFSAIELIRSDAELNRYFLKRASDTLAVPDPGELNEGQVPGELLELATHELQWDEMQRLAEDRISQLFGGDMDRALGDVSRKIIEARSSTWPDREFYSRYQASE